METPNLEVKLTCTWVLVFFFPSLPFCLNVNNSKICYSNILLSLQCFYVVCASVHVSVQTVGSSLYSSSWICLRISHNIYALRSLIMTSQFRAVLVLRLYRVTYDFYLVTFFFYI